MPISLFFFLNNCSYKMRIISNLNFYKHFGRFALLFFSFSFFFCAWITFLNEGKAIINTNLIPVKKKEAFFALAYISTVLVKHVIASVNQFSSKDGASAANMLVFRFLCNHWAIPSAGLRRFGDQLGTFLVGHPGSQSKSVEP